MDASSVWEWWCLVSSDRHLDSKKSDRDLQLKHLRQARERNAAIFDNGDFFDLTGGKLDKRSRKSDLRPEYEVPNDFDAVIADAASFFGPFARNFVTVATGNHETSVLRHHDINPTERFVTLMNAVYGGSLTNGGYSGFLFFNFKLVNCPTSRTIIANHHHGLTAGKTPSNVSAHERRAAYVPDADIIAEVFQRASQVLATMTQVGTEGQLDRIDKVRALKESCSQAVIATRVIEDGLVDKFAGDVLDSVFDCLKGSSGLSKSTSARSAVRRTVPSAAAGNDP